MTADQIRYLSTWLAAVFVLAMLTTAALTMPVAV